MSKPLDSSVPLLQRLRQKFWPRPASISQRLAFGVVLIVILTVLFAALPAVGAILLQLQQQVELSVQKTQLATQAFYDAESERLLDLTKFIAERPTLCALLISGDREALIPYLEQAREGTSIDALVLVPAGQPPLVSGQLELPALESLHAGRTLPFADYIPRDEPPQLFLVAASEIDRAGQCASEAPGWVMAVQAMDDQEMHSMARQTGLEQSLIVAGRRAATSLPAAPDWPLDPQAAQVVQRTFESCCTSVNVQKEIYYVGLAPLLDSQGRLVALSEVALLGVALRRDALNSILLLFGASALVALVSALAALALTRRITRPLGDLAEAARGLSRGDLNKPIPAESDWIEINQLAEQLELSRRHLYRTFQANQRETRQVMRMLSAIREGVVRLDTQGYISWLNPDAERILGLSAAEALRVHHTRVFRPAPGASAVLSDLLQPAPGSPSLSRLEILGPQDQPLSLAISVSWIETGDGPGSQRERLLVFHQITGDLDSNRPRSEFLANLAHEFRTPLSSIAASIELLTEEGSSMSQDELAELANTASLSTRHLQTLIDNLLESTLVEADSFHLRCHPILLRDVIHHAVEIMSPLLKRRQQPLELDEPRDFLTLLADPDRLCQVVVNLLDNASKYSPFGSTIYLSFKRQGSELLFTLLDSGPGLPPDLVGDIFQRYVSVNNPMGARPGIGLGLPLVKTIIEAHGGRVGADNRPEGGARFWFTLPLKPKTER